jgi:rRNA maturation endonuclease Nob1
VLILTVEAVHDRLLLLSWIAGVGNRAASAFRKEVPMKVQRKIKVIQCPEGHNSWMPKAKYCQQCGGRLKKVKVEITEDVCPQCKRVIDWFASPFPIKYCAFCGEQLVLESTEQ